VLHRSNPDQGGAKQSEQINHQARASTDSRRFASCVGFWSCLSLPRRQAPRAERGCERPAGAEEERLQIGVDPVGRRLEKDAPVPVVVHAALSLPKTQSN
jgi:hypothetical protein